MLKVRGTILNMCILAGWVCSFSWTTRSISLPLLISHNNHTLQWSHNERGGFSYQRDLDCLFNSLFRRRPFWKEFVGDRWIPHTKGQWSGLCFHLVTSSWRKHTGDISPRSITVHSQVISSTGNLNEANLDPSGAFKYVDWSPLI